MVFQNSLKRINNKSQSSTRHRCLNRLEILTRMNNSANNTIEHFLYTENKYFLLIKFSLLFPIDFLSIVLHIFIFKYFYKKNRQHRNIFDDTLILLLVVSLVDILCQNSGVLIYFCLSHVWPSSSIYCLIWNYFDYFDYYLNLALTVWGSAERHLFIFHFRFFENQRKSFFFHQVPIILIILYGIFVYMGLIFFYPCENQFDYSKVWCGGVCFRENVLAYYLDWLINNVLLICLIILLNLSLIIRFVRYRNRWNENRLNLFRCRKLIVQMLSISMIYLICFLPNGLIYVLRLLFRDPQLGEVAMTVAFQYFFLLANALLPLVILNLLPDLKRKMRLTLKRLIPVFPQKIPIRIKPIETQN